MVDLVIVDPDNDDEDAVVDGKSTLVSWVVERVRDWEDHRNTNFRKRWNEYYRLWRGIYRKEDATRESERSRLIAPALSQAIEATVAELSEATFGGAKWFDVFDDTLDEQSADINMFRDQLREDMEKAGIPDAMQEIFLNGAIYGTGIGKIVVDKIEDKQVEARQIGETEVTRMSVITTPEVEVSLVPVHPQEFVIDTAARSVDEAMGVAHITVVPRWTVERKQALGIYDEDADISSFNQSLVGNRGFNSATNDRHMFQDVRNRDKTLIIEYHGLVPRQLLLSDEELQEELDQVEPLFEEDDGRSIDESDLVEAIVTIANGTALLRGIENPYEMKDRGFVAYQHDTVPNRFWGRGVAEKGYNPQKALDAEMRGRIDAMALTIHPMMGMDATRMNRGNNFRVEPGRALLTNGDPSTVLFPLNFGQVNNNTFSQSGELERMVQMGTGAMDSATPLAENRRNETSSGMSMIMSGAVKRSKRTLANIERTFTKPLIEKVAWRYMQLAPDRYPAADMKFVVHSTLGLIARELEQAQMAQMMQTVPPESPAFWMLLKGIYENSSISNREQMLPVIDFMMQQSLQQQAQPDDSAAQLLAIEQQKLALEAQIEQAKLQVEAQENQDEMAIELEKLKIEYEKLRLKEKELILDAQVEVAKMQQDSAVTVAQMQGQAATEVAKARATAREKSNGSGATAEKAPVVQIVEKMEAVQPPEPKPKKKKIKVTKVEDGFEGTSEEIDG